MGNDGRRLAKARDIYIKKNPRSLKTPVKNPYLQNRIMLAFCAGWNARSEDLKQLCGTQKAKIAWRRKKTL